MNENGDEFDVIGMMALRSGSVGLRVRVAADIAEWLEARAAQYGVSVSELVRALMANGIAPADGRPGFFVQMQQGNRRRS